MGIEIQEGYGDERDGVATHTPGPWEYIASNENHGPYVVGPWGGDVADCYTMSNLSDRAVCNGGTSKPVPFQHEAADANARLIAAAPDLLAALTWALPLAIDRLELHRLDRLRSGHDDIGADRGHDIGLWDDEVGERERAREALSKATRL